MSKSFQAWTDYPIEELGDASGYAAEVRPCTVLGFDGDKYLTVEVEGVVTKLKCGYVYQRKGRLGQVPAFHYNWLRRRFR